MKARSFLILAAITALVVAADVFVPPQAPATVSGVGEKVFPDLARQIENAAAIVVRGPHDTVTVEKTATGWSIKERDDYPASFKKVKAAVLSLITLERSEPKTSRPENFTRLELTDPGKAGASGREISILNGAGQPLARVIVGKTVHDLGGDSSVFIRVPGEQQAWLARGQVDAGTQPRDWIDRRILNISSGDIERIHVVRPDGSTLTVVRDAAKSPKLTLEELPKGMRLNRPDSIESVITALSPLDVEDVRPATDVAGSGKDAAERTRIELRTFGGESVSATLYDRGGDRWLQITDVSGAPPNSIAAGASGTELARWAYQVPGWKVAPLLKPISEMVEPDKPEKAPVPH